MKGWLRSRRGTCGLALAGAVVALAVAIGRGQTPQSSTEPRFPATDEPQMVGDAPKSPRSPPLPVSPFTPPSPRPLPPEQAVPFEPQLPYPAAVPLDPPEPIVRLRIGAPRRAEPGKDIEYRLTVENISRADAHHVVVRDRLPRGIKEAVRAEPSFTKKETKDDFVDLLWDLGSLKAGENKTIVLAIKPAANEDVHNRAYVQFEHGQQVTTRVAKPGMQVKVTAPAQSLLYQSIPIRLDVANTGDVPLRNVVVTDDLPDGLEFVDGKPAPKPDKPLTWKLGDLPPQQSRHIEYQVISKAAGKFRNNARVTAEGGARATGSAAVTVGEAKLAIRISGPQNRLVNRSLPYHITVRNLGSVALTKVQVSGEVPPRVGVDKISLDGRQEGGFVRWSLGTLVPGDQRSLLLVLRASETGQCGIEAAVRADNKPEEKARSETRIEAASAPVIEIDKERDLLVVGQKNTYTIRLFNPGKKGVLNPSVIVRVPEEMAITANRGETTGQQQGQTVRFDSLPVLDAGEAKEYTIEVEAKKAGEVKLQAWWTDGRIDNGPTQTWEDKTTILNSSRAVNRIATRMRQATR